MIGKTHHYKTWSTIIPNSDSATVCANHAVTVSDIYPFQTQ